MVPLGFVVQHLARERALADAERHSATVVAVLAVTTDPAKVITAVGTANGEQANLVAVHGLAPNTIGTSHVDAHVVNTVAVRRRPEVVAVPGGVARLEPVTTGEGPPMVVEVFVPEEALSGAASRAWLTLTATAVLLLIFSVLISDRLSVKVVRSARDLADAARRLSEGDLDVRVDTSRYATGKEPRELVEAGLAVNAMADRAAARRAAERELIADLSHRLRTPLTALRLEAEQVEPGTQPSRLRQAVDAMEHEVDLIIRTARAPAEPTATATDEQGGCDAGAVIRERMAFWAPVAVDQGRPYRVVGAQRRAPVGVVRSELAAAIDALLGNVFRYTPQGTAFEVGVSRRDGWVAVRVDDGGPGIADPQRALRRGTSERGSTGLGLDIARRVAVAGDGSVDIDRAALGGASVVVLLADVENPPPRHQWLGFVGRLARDPSERRGRWRRAPARIPTRR